MQNQKNLFSLIYLLIPIAPHRSFLISFGQRLICSSTARPLPLGWPQSRDLPATARMTTANTNSTLPQSPSPPISISRATCPQKRLSPEKNMTSKSHFISTHGTSLTDTQIGFSTISSCSSLVGVCALSPNYSFGTCNEPSVSHLPTSHPRAHTTPPCCTTPSSVSLPPFLIYLTSETTSVGTHSHKRQRATWTKIAKSRIYALSWGCHFLLPITPPRASIVLAISISASFSQSSICLTLFVHMSIVRYEWSNKSSMCVPCLLSHMLRVSC